LSRRSRNEPPIAQRCPDAGLPDEIVVQVAPVLLGDGSALSTVPEAKFKLEKVGVAESGHLTNLRFQLAKHAKSRNL